MTPAEARAALIRMGVCPEAAARAEIGGEASIPVHGPEVAETGGESAEKATNSRSCARAQTVPIPPSCWTIRIPDWHPPSENLWTGRHWTVKARIKKVATGIIGGAVHRAGIPKADVKRRVWLHLVMGPGQRMPDAENLWKATLDALKNAGALKQDSPRWVAAERPTFSRGERAETFITVEDVG